MSYEWHDEVKARALAAVNVIRVAAGFKPLSELPKGRQDDCEECPIAHALGDGVLAYTNVLDFGNSSGYGPCMIAEFIGRDPDDEDADECDEIPTPAAIAKFIREFDNDSFPDLIEGEVAHD